MNNLYNETYFKRMSLGTTVRLLFCDFEVMGSNPKNSLFACRGKAAYIYPSKTPPGGSLVN